MKNMKISKVCLNETPLKYTRSKVRVKEFPLNVL